jgi:hypothetical protein
MTDRTDNTSLRILDRHRSGERVSARKHNQVVDVVDEMRRGVAPPRQVVRTVGGKGDAEELESIAPIIVILEDQPDWTNDALQVPAWWVEQKRRTSPPTGFDYVVARSQGAAMVMPGRTLGWYRSNVHLHPAGSVTVGMEITRNPRYLRLLRPLRYWDSAAEEFKHWLYVD